jgi:hypothetical protein
VAVIVSELSPVSRAPLKSRTSTMTLAQLGSVGVGVSATAQVPPAAEAGFGDSLLTTPI